MARLPEDIAPVTGEPPTSRDFAVVRQYGAGHILVYAHDGLTRDNFLDDQSDNLLFAENALAWLTPVHPDDQCEEKRTTILIWEGTFVRAANMRAVQGFVEARGWALKVANPDSLASDLQCAEVLWYLSDWSQPMNFVTGQVPLIEEFVRTGGGPLVGGLGWSYAQQGGPDRGAAVDPYTGDQLGEPFGFRFTTDAFPADGEHRIRLLPGVAGPAPSFDETKRAAPSFSEKKR